MSRPHDGGFAARALMWRVGGLLITQITTDAVGWLRTAERVRNDRTDHIYVNYHYRGGFTVDCGDGARRGAAGSLLAIDMRQPVRMDDGPTDKVYVAMPRKAVLDRLEGYDPHGFIVSSPMTALLGETLRAICATLPRLTPREAPAIERTIVDLVVDTLVDGLRAAEARSAREEALTSRVRTYIDRHLGDDLDVGALCRALGVSRSGLYRAFGTEGGVLRGIQLRRLRRVRALLLDPSETRSIAAIAQATGFADKSHLTRQFKQTFGTTPGAFRQASAAVPPRRPAASDEAAQRFNAWVSDLN